jgi:two-component system, NtrC family, response regulator AtoC
MRRILVVDDESGVREFVAEALEADGYATHALPSAEAALEELGKRSYALLFTDLKMPGMGGLELLVRARELQPELEVIVLTAQGSVDVAVDAMRRGAFDFIQKPVSGPQELRLLAARALERRSLLDIKENAARGEANEPTLSYGDPKMEPVVEALHKVAKTTATVLLVGESGTGKEVAARAVHRWSARHDGPFVAINCAALSENLLESELFGHEKGAFTGALATKRGRIELAAGGTFFLDEVGELKPQLQAKLLRVLQERSFERVGGSRSITADVRWVAATNRDLGRLVADGEFREDLYHRLAVFPVKLPPLRERRADIPHLARALVERIGTDVGKVGLSIDAAAEQRLLGASWPGNVRELRNALERAAILAEGKLIRAEHIVLDPLSTGADPLSGTLDEIERRAIERALGEVEGNRKRCAERLGIGLRTLYEKLKQYELG